ncbi:pentatricopeptide repeat-containing protein At5g50390, chloroplastic-like [Prosopis cineraria]|uniref:pentatricopeptide repeat-containing protein At5g50390, chloroplastic-like n=1 Tax=Prosopis cineraria TaxID=364024 RepID=UPI0024100E14|nr:pentatricopeptide repeat-containing protein At5g50390, chloroplastic-like [Prosopis cineraria]
MIIPFSLHQTSPFDLIETPCGLAVLSNKCMLNGGKCMKPSSRILCSSTEQGLRPRPMPKPSKIGFDERQEPVLERSRIKKPPSGLCSQIEKLVLCCRYREAWELFEFLELQSGYDVSSSTYDALVSACIGLKSISGVKRVFRYMVTKAFEPDLYMRNRVLLMHVKCGLMVDACKLFGEMPERNLLSWNTILAGLVDSGRCTEAIRLFLIMWEEVSDGCSRTFATMIRASAGLSLIHIGRQFHSCALKIGVGEDIFVSCALIDMYSKCGVIEDAQFVFDLMPEKTIVGWNSIIAGYALHGYSEQALEMYYEMRDCGVKMDHFTFSIVIRICARLASLEHAKQAHAALVRHGFGSDIVANTALVDFYSKWGRMEDARHVFNRMPCKNVISWNALIAGYGNHGQGDEAVNMFEQMLREGMIPNHVTFLAVLSACSYSGLSERGWEFFQSMSRDHKIKPRAMHYACMIELLGRQGLLDEAFALIRSAPFKPTTNMWAALLTACRMNENLELGKFAAEKLYGMEPEKLSNYVVLLNIYNRAGKLKEAAGVVQSLKRKGLRMLPACTWIEVKKQPFAFLSGDKSHPKAKEIYRKVDDLMLKISRHGYIVENRTLLPDVDEDEQRVLKYHSEKLAIAFGLISTREWTPLQITQSHRICSDCHIAIKYIAMVTGREIVLRDASRFHHFRNGTCSCGDYW